MLLTVTLISTLGSNPAMVRDQFGPLPVLVGSTHTYSVSGEPNTLSGLVYGEVAVPTRADFEAIALGLVVQQVSVDEDIRSITAINFLRYLD